ncbi:pentapeptide repeat-containing protein [Ruegeria sp. HKCCD8929]|uniref:pentapeptide repeat-containing protein n=1 Tax=Ruegeria sp. HKCCD8929 TaxID=2683006 RepID=UPI0014878638|nr:pentapeptide repeat-containing protein [Ruegeria sp. HKCCD8929]
MTKPVEKPANREEREAEEEDELIAREETQIAHFNELVPTGRGNWLALLAYLTFIFVTVLAVEDIDFFLPLRNTALPLVNVTIPTRSFFVFAPILGAALYIYLHFNIRQVVDAFRNLPKEHKGQHLEEFLKPWLLVDHLQRVRHVGQPRRMDALTGFTTIFMVWLAGPLVFGYFWIRSWPAHSEWITTIVGLSLSVSIYAGLSTWMLFRNIRGQRSDPINVGFVSTVIALVIIAVGFVRTDLGGSMTLKHGSVKIESLLAGTNLQEALLTTQDVGTWRNRETFGRELAQAACDRAGIPKAICGAGIEDSDDPRVALLLERGYQWCSEELGITQAECDVLRDEIRFDVLQEWQRRTRELYSGSPSLDLSGVDLRNANLRGATIRNVDFSDADLRGADFSGAVLESVDFGGANLTNAIFERAEISNTTFINTNLNGTQFREARLRSLTFFGSLGEPTVETSFSGSNLRNVYIFSGNFDKVDFSGADVSSAFLYLVSLPNSNLRNVRIKNSILIGVDLEASDWSGAWLRRTLLGFVKVGDAEIENDQLDELVALSKERWYAAVAARPGPKRAVQDLTTGVDFTTASDEVSEDLFGVVIEEEVTEGMFDDRFDLPLCWERVPQEIKRMMWSYTRTSLSHPEYFRPALAAFTCE